MLAGSAGPLWHDVPSALENPPSWVPIWIPCILPWSSSGKCFVIYDPWFCVFQMLQISSICWGSTKLSKTSRWWGLQRNCQSDWPRGPRSPILAPARLEPSWRALLVCDSLKLKDNIKLEGFRSDSDPLAEVVVDACIWWCAVGLRSFPDDLCSRHILGDAFSVFCNGPACPGKVWLGWFASPFLQDSLQGRVWQQRMANDDGTGLGSLETCQSVEGDRAKSLSLNFSSGWRKLQLWNLRSDYHWTLGKEFAGMVVLKLALTEAWDRCCEDRLCWDLCQALVETFYFWAEISGPSLAQFHDFHAWKGEKILLLALFTEQQWGVFGWCPNKRVLWFIKSPRFCPTIPGEQMFWIIPPKTSRETTEGFWGFWGGKI